MGELMFNAHLRIQMSKIETASALTADGSARFLGRFRLLSALGNLVGLGRLELPTSPLSGVRSSHLSYRPGLACTKLSGA